MHRIWYVIFVVSAITLHTTHIHSHTNTYIYNTKCSDDTDVLEIISQQCCVVRNVMYSFVRFKVKNKTKKTLLNLYLKVFLVWWITLSRWQKKVSSSPDFDSVGGGRKIFVMWCLLLFSECQFRLHSGRSSCLVQFVVMNSMWHWGGRSVWVVVTPYARPAYRIYIGNNVHSITPPSVSILNVYLLILLYYNWLVIMGEKMMQLLRLLLLQQRKIISISRLSQGR